MRVAFAGSLLAYVCGMPIHVLVYIFLYVASIQLDEGKSSFSCQKYALCTYKLQLTRMSSILFNSSKLVNVYICVTIVCFCLSLLLL